MKIMKLFLMLGIAVTLRAPTSDAQRDFSRNCDIIDVGLLIDSSDNVGEMNFEMARTFIVNFITVMNTGLQSTRLAAIQDGGQLVWDFNDSDDQEELIRRTNSMIYRGGEQRLATSFNYLVSNTFASENGDRPEVPDVVVIFTGGEANSDVMEMIELLKDRQIHVVMVTVGDEFDFRWKELASTPVEENFFNLDNAFHIVFLLQDPNIAQCHDGASEATTTTPLHVATNPSAETTATTTESTTTTTTSSSARTTTATPTTISSTVATDTNHPSSCPHGAWTRWFNSDGPEDIGDDETLWTLRNLYPDAICEYPYDFEARAAATGIPLNSSITNVFASRFAGLECLNFIGDPCQDYEIRFCCQNEDLEDEIFLGESSTTSILRTAISEKTSQSTKSSTTATTTTSAPITEVTTTTTTTTVPPTTVTPTTATSTTTASTPQTEAICPPGSWSPWFNNDDPQGFGDDETLTTLRSRYPGVICESPTDFEARSVATRRLVKSSSGNVYASRVTGLECVNLNGEECEDYEIRFCCVKGPRCYVGPKTSGLRTNQDLQAEVECSPGELCADVTATMETRLGGRFTSTNSIGMCMSRDTCNNFTCQHIRERIPSSSNLHIRDCQASCCHGDLCNQPRTHQSTTTTTEATTKTRERGTQCFVGFNIEGSPALARYGGDKLGFNVKECEAGLVCSDLVASPIFPRGLFPGAVVHQAQCLPPVACGSTDCNYIRSLLPNSMNVGLVNCSSRCCDYDNCNKPQGNIKSTEVASSSAPTPSQGQKTSYSTKSISEKTTSQEKVTSPTPRPVIKMMTTTPPYDDEFLPSCTVSQTVKTVFWCESLLSKPQPYKGLDTCRNKIKEFAKCVEKQLKWCVQGKGENKLDMLNLPGLNSQVILKLLGDAQSETSEINTEINNFCFHAGYNYDFTQPITRAVDGCHANYLNELREQTKKYYYTYTWARGKEEICRASRSFKLWLVKNTYRKCTLQGMEQLGYTPATIEHLKILANAALRTLKRLEPQSCKEQSIL